MSVDNKEVLKAIENEIGLYPDFPKEGILFRDIMPILSKPDLFNTMIDVICERLGGLEIDRVLGIESRGFLIGPTIAQKLRLPFGPIRKKGKLPGELYRVEYDLEYGSDVLEVQKNVLPRGSRILVVDDLIATGGSLNAAKSLIEMSGSRVVCYAVIIELGALNGREKLGDTRVVTLFSY